MKTILTATLLLFSFYAQAQITKEHSYPENNPVYVCKLEQEGYKYYALDSSGKKVRFYNTDHSLWKEITLVPPNYHSIVGISYPSEHLFNSNNQLEFIAVYVDNNVPIPHYITQIVDENANALYNFPDTYAGYIINVAGNWKMMASTFYTGTN
jgi:hypothetical protein